MAGTAYVGRTVRAFCRSLASLRLIASTLCWLTFVPLFPTGALAQTVYPPFGYPINFTDHYTDLLASISSEFANASPNGQIILNAEALAGVAGEAWVHGVGGFAVPVEVPMTGDYTITATMDYDGALYLKGFSVAGCMAGVAYSRATLEILDESSTRLDSQTFELGQVATGTESVLGCPARVAVQQVIDQLFPGLALLWGLEGKGIRLHSLGHDFTSALVHLSPGTTYRVVLMLQAASVVAAGAAGQLTVGAMFKPSGLEPLPPAYPEDPTVLKSVTVTLQSSSCTDSDKDGYYAQSNCGSQVDCDDTDGSVNPGAAERCDNAIDDDCDLEVNEGCPCQIGEVVRCGTDTGECTTGTKTCSCDPAFPGCTLTKWGECTGNGPSPETCPHNGKDNDCDGQVDDNYCGGSDICSDGSSSFPPYFRKIHRGDYCANQWRVSDIDGDGYSEWYILISEPFRTWMGCFIDDLLYETDGLFAQDIQIEDPRTHEVQHGCARDGGNGDSPVGMQYCNYWAERSYHDQWFSEPSDLLMAPRRSCVASNGASVEWNPFRLSQCWPDCDKPSHTEPYLILRCGQDSDCGPDQYCNKPTLSDPLTYLCAARCGNGVCDPGENCPADAQGSEVCDGIDNDCDGVVDGIVRPCGSDTGQCRSGTQTCTSGQWGACSGVGPVPELCNGLDDDCDGVVDNAFPRGQPCDGSDSDFCPYGFYTCRGDGVGVECVNEVVTDIRERCRNASDDDCDGFADALDTDCHCPDADHDGYGPRIECTTEPCPYCDPVDCDDTDPRVSPGAAENCTNGKDDDCDSLADCDDAACATDPSCTTTTTTSSTTSTTTASTTTTTTTVTTTTTLPPVGPELSAEPVCGMLGGRVRLPVSLSKNGEAVASVGFTLGYPSGVLCVEDAAADVECSAAVAAQGFSCLGQADCGVGSVQVAVTPPQQVPVPELPDGEVVEVTFGVDGGAAPGQGAMCSEVGPECVALPFIEVDFGSTAGEDIAAGVGDEGCVDILSCKQGDCNGTGQVTTPDVTCCILRYFDAVEQASACEDCNGDGRVTTADVTCTILCLFGMCPAL